MILFLLFACLGNSSKIEAENLLLAKQIALEWAGSGGRVRSCLNFSTYDRFDCNVVTDTGCEAALDCYVTKYSCKSYRTVCPNQAKEPETYYKGGTKE